MIDADGDPSTQDDQDFAAGWEFNLDTDATIIDSEPVTGDGEDGFAWFVLELSQSTDATMTEDLQDGYKLIDAICYDLGGLDEEAAVSRFKAAAAGDEVGKLDGDSVSFNVDPETAYGCVFVNTLSLRTALVARRKHRRSPSRRPTRSAAARWHRPTTPGGSCWS